jgi:hypothetical protein
MVAKLSTTINKIQNLSNYSNSKTLIEFLTYMKNNGSGNIIVRKISTRIILTKINSIETIKS